MVMRSWSVLIQVTLNISNNRKETGAHDFIWQYILQVLNVLSCDLHPQNKTPLVPHEDLPCPGQLGCLQLGLLPPSPPALEGHHICAGPESYPRSSIQEPQSPGATWWCKTQLSSTELLTTEGARQSEREENETNLLGSEIATQAKAALTHLEAQ